MRMDRADVEAREVERQRLEAERLYEARNSVLKRSDLPRPTKVAAVVQGDAIAQEMQTLLQHDAMAYPVVEKKSSKKRKLMEAVPSPLQDISEAALAAAKSLLQTELEFVVEEKVTLVLQDGKAENREAALDFLVAENVRESRRGAENMVPDGQGGWIEGGDRVTGLRHEFLALQEATEALQKKNDKLANKLGVVNGGYQKRAEKLQADTKQAAADLESARMEEAVYSNLQRQEAVGGARRVELLQQEIKALRAAEVALQKRYGELVIKRRQQQVAAKSK